MFEDWEVVPEERKWQYEIQPVNTERVNFLNVMQMGPSSLSQFDSLQHITGKGNSGVLIGNWVVVFAADETIRSEVSYLVDAPVAGQKHLVADLKPGLYRVSAGEEILEDIHVAENDNTAFFTTQCTNSACNVSLAWQQYGVVIQLEMPSHFFHTGETAYTRVIVSNTNPSTFTGYPLFVLLDVYGQYFFAPGFSSFDYFDRNFPNGDTVVEVIPEFIWPESVGTASGLFWFAAFTNPEMTALFGNLDVCARSRYLHHPASDVLRRSKTTT